MNDPEELEDPAPLPASNSWLDDVGELDIRMAMALQAILTHRNVSQVARTFGRSQPGMSNALNRMRRIFEDPLLVRSKSGMRLTPRGEQLRENLTALNAQMERLFRPETFDPRLSEKTFRIVATDAASLMFGGKLIQRVRAEGPNIEIALHSQQSLAGAKRRQHDYCLLLGYARSADHNKTVLKLFTDDLVIICRHGLLPDDQAASAADLGKLAQIAPSSDSSEFFHVVDRWLFREGLAEKVVARASSLAVIPAIVSQSDLIAAFPASLAAVFASDFPLQVVRTAPPLPRLSFYAEWPTRLDDDPSQRWLLDTLKATAQELHRPPAAPKGLPEPN